MLPILTTILVWGILFCGFAGWGGFWGRLLLKDFELSASRCFWLGYAFAIALLQIWNLFLPIDWKPGVLLIATGAALFFSPAQRSLCRLQFQEKRGLKIAGLILLSVWCARFAIAPPAVYDSGLYHFQSVRWANEYPLVPGLGNLHTRLGFNQSHFLYVAMLNFTPWAANGHNFANGLLLLVLLGQLYFAAVRFFNRMGETTPALLLQVFFIPVAVFQIAHGEISSPSPDLPVYVLTALIFIEFVKIISGKTREFKDSAIIYVAVLICAVVTTKLSAIVFGFLTLVCLLAGKIIHHRGLPEVRKLLCSLIGIGLLLLLPWMVRGVIATGYPLFPSTALAVDVDWKVPKEAADLTAQWIYAWAKWPGHDPSEVLGNWRWLGPWIEQTRKNHQAMSPVYLLVLSIPFLLFSWRKLEHRRWFLVSLVPLFGWLAFWFFTAPDPRFAGPLFWLVGLWPIAAAIQRWNWWTQRPRTACALMMCLTFVLLLTPKFGLSKLRRPGNMRRISNEFGAVPVATLKEQVTHSGLKLLIPEKEQAWNAPLPSTPYFDPQLSARGESLRKGFRTEPAPGGNRPLSR